MLAYRCRSHGNGPPRRRRSATRFLLPERCFRSAKEFLSISGIASRRFVGSRGTRWSLRRRALATRRTASERNYFHPLSPLVSRRNRAKGGAIKLAPKVRGNDSSREQTMNTLLSKVLQYFRGKAIIVRSSHEPTIDQGIC